MSTVLFFDEPAAKKLVLSGGKGANLSKMTQAGFPVPFGFVVTADAYRLFIQQADFLPALLNELDYQHPENLVGQAQQIREKLSTVSLPIEISNAVREKLASFPPDTYFSVRSSSTMEDLSGAAFAGQHDTFLNCLGFEEILNKIRDCFISLWHDRAILYRQKQGFCQDEVTMAVVVQKMVHADKAGVGFSINPITSHVGEIVVNANYGLGESVVSGESEVDQFVISKTDFQILNSSIAHKQMCIMPTTQGTIEKEIASELADVSCLSEDEVKRIAQLNQAVESHYSFPQDIEWAIEAGELYLLQARPITTIAPHWTRDESAERYPNVLTPFTWDYVDKAFHISLKHSFELMGLPSFDGKWFSMFDNYIYGNQNAVWLYMGQSPVKIKSVDDLTNQIPELEKRFAYAKELPSRWNRDLDTYLQQIGALMFEDISRYDMKQVWGYIQKVVEVGTEYFKPNIAISITQAMLYKVFKSLLKMVTQDDDKANALFDALTSTTETKTALVNNELYALAQMIIHDTALRADIEQRTSSEFLSSGLLQNYPQFNKEFSLFLSRHGHRETDFDAYVPTWVENPSVVLDNIRLIVNNPYAKSPTEKEKSVKAEKYKALQELMSIIPEQMKVLVTELLDLVQTYTVLDDVEHYQTTRITLPIRKGAKALGLLLQEKGIISEPSDVFFAHIETLRSCIEDGQDLEVLKAEIEREKANFYQNAERTPVWDLSQPHTDMAEDVNEDSVLMGLAGSAGVAEGPVYIIHSTADFASFPKDAVLVARTTNPAWTPLFYNAKALITESGGPLSHGAVTAREMKLPAVMSVRNVLKLLKNGQNVRVDGNSGKVYLIQD